MNAFVRWRHRNVFGHGERLDATLLGGARDSGARVMLLGDLPWTRRLGYQLGGQLHEERPVVYRGGEEIGREAFSRDTGFLGAHAAVGPEILLQARFEAGRVTTDARRRLGDGGRDTYRMVNGLAAFDHLDDHELPESGLAIVVRGEHSLSGDGRPRLLAGARRRPRRASSRGGFVAEVSGSSASRTATCRNTTCSASAARAISPAIRARSCGRGRWPGSRPASAATCSASA